MSTHTELPIFDRRAHERAIPEFSLTLTFEQRSKGRLRALGDDGREVALMLERGHVLRDGTLLTGPAGEVLLIRAAPERVSEVRSRVARELARAAYHLGNRHVALQIGADWLRYLGDHVLDEMMRGLGFDVHALEAPFEPESGAYASASYRHHAELGHSHGHEH